jgi:hypothetical protein
MEVSDVMVWLANQSRQGECPIWDLPDHHRLNLADMLIAADTRQCAERTRVAIAAESPHWT